MRRSGDRAGVHESRVFSSLSGSCGGGVRVAAADQLRYDPTRGEGSYGRELLQLRDRVSMGVSGAVHDRSWWSLDRDVGVGIAGDNSGWKKWCAVQAV